LEVRDDDDLASDQILGRVLGGDSGDDGAFFVAGGSKRSIDGYNAFSFLLFTFVPAVRLAG
jgi:hypothetical protein